MKKRAILTVLLSIIFAGLIFATTWFDADVICPVCKTKNKFKEIGSYGGYIYNWPSKYQYIYWPATDNYSIYSCKKCMYSSMMWDFAKIEGDILKLIEKSIDTMTIEMKFNKDYSKISSSQKLETAELFYRLYKTEPEFWCRFYRIKGYHYMNEDQPEKAKQSRLKVLEIADSLLQVPENVSIKKELLIITAGMKHFTVQDSLALVDLAAAKKLKYKNPNQNADYNEGLDEYLSVLIEDYIKLINGEDK
jgi:hypothetical protein